MAVENNADEISVFKLNHIYLGKFRIVKMKKTKKSIIFFK